MEITIFTLIILVFSIMIHEIAHGSVANWLGDPTAKLSGRLTLNPIKHLDLFGSIILPLLLLSAYIFSGVRGPLVGWAKPVPINPYNFRDKKWGLLKVSLAGPIMNFLIAVIFSLLIRFLPLPASLLILFGIVAIYNFLWGLFNLLPIPPLDGAHILFSLFPGKLTGVKLFLGQYGFFVLIFLIFFGGLDMLFMGANILFFLVSGHSF